MAHPVCLAVVLVAAMGELYDGAVTRMVRRLLRPVLDVTTNKNGDASAPFSHDPPRLTRAFSTEDLTVERLRASMALVEAGQPAAWTRPAHLRPPSTSRQDPDSGLAYEVVNQRDGSELVLVPAGPFAMGAHASVPDPRPSECPIHMVTLPAYYVGRTEVTRAQYETFCRESGHPRLSKRFALHCPRSDDPVVGVRVDDARAYCAWAGASLPTEAQWEKAARGTDGRLFPWGNESPSVHSGAYANFAEQAARQDTQGKRAPGPAPVGSFPEGASPYGALDMAGNVHEWCLDLYDPNYYEHGPSFHPTGARQSTHRVIRGGCWSSDAYSIRTFARSSRILSDVPDKRIGFRIVVNLVPRVRREMPSVAAGALHE